MTPTGPTPAGPVGEADGVGSSPIDRAYDEFCRREQAGEVVDVGAFCERYRDIRSSLVRLLQAHEFLKGNPELLEDAPPAWPEPGQTFAGFRLLGVLGRGSFARVYLATEAALGHRLVALKVSPAGAAEARTLGRVRHPNVVTAYSVTTDPESGLAAICMPYLGCTTLGDVLDRLQAPGGEVPSDGGFLGRVVHDREAALHDLVPEAPFPAVPRGGPGPSYAAAVEELARRLLDALAWLHDEGILHHDLKPSNVLLGSDGAPMLLDFNLCADRRREAGRLGGTMPYMSPEQLHSDGGADPLDGRSDLFSLAIVLYELLTGAHPFGPLPVQTTPRELGELLTTRHRHGARPLRDLNPAAGLALAGLVDRCLAADPSARPASARAALTLLDPPTAPRRRRWAAVLALVLAGIVPLSAAVMVPRPAEPTPTERAREARRKGDARQAVRHLSEALEANPGDVDALLARARAYQDLAAVEPDLYDRALADLRAADDRQPSPATKARVGYILLLQEQAGRAVPFLEAAASAAPSAAVFTNLGVAHLKVRQFEAAANAFDRAVALGPTAAVYHNRALLSFKRLSAIPAAATKRAEERARHLALAIQDIDEAVRLGPVSGQLLADAAMLHAYAAAQDAAELPKALDLAARALELGADPKALSGSGWRPFQDHERVRALRARAPLEHPSAKAVLLLDPSAD